MKGLARNSHIVPVFYLRRWANADDQIEMVLSGTGAKRTVTVRRAGVRKGIYDRERPTGEIEDDIERISLARTERAAAPHIKLLLSGEPLDGDAKMTTARYLGIQLLRGPRWFAWHTNFNKTSIEEYRRAGKLGESSKESGESEAQIIRQMLDVERRAAQVTMLRFAAKAGSVLGCMHWTVIQFPEPWLATSDHPLVTWPTAVVGQREAESVDPGSIGLVHFLEARIPLSPTVGLLMNWQDRADPTHAVRGERRHAFNFNAFTIAQAESQWFYKPGASRPPRIKGSLWSPLTPELYPDYSAEVVDCSTQRRWVWHQLEKRVHLDPDNREHLIEDLKCEIRFIGQRHATDGQAAA